MDSCPDRFNDIDWSGLDMTRADFAALTSIDVAAWQSELELHTEWFAMLGDRLPETLRLNLEQLRQRLSRERCTYF